MWLVYNKLRNAQPRTKRADRHIMACPLAEGEPPGPLGVGLAATQAV